MLIKELMETTEMEMDEALDATRHELAMIRTGRACRGVGARGSPDRHPAV